MTNQSFESVGAAFDSILGGDVAQKLKASLNERSLVLSLVSMRVVANVTQGQIAEELGCTQSRVSKLENGIDAGVDIRHIKAYAKLTKKEFSIIISDRGKGLADQIKHHAFMIRTAFLALAKLAHKDEKIAQGVAELHVQAFFNINRFLQETAANLPTCPENGEPYIRILDAANESEDERMENESIVSTERSVDNAVIV